MICPPKNSDDPEHALDAGLSVHIFTVSATMVGVCLTAIGLIRVVITMRGVETLIDDLVALDALLFVISGLMAYFGIRSRKLGRLHQCELMAEKVFIVAMSVMGLSCLALVYGIHFL